MLHTADYLNDYLDAHGNPEIAVETGDPARPWVLGHDPAQWEPCGDCAGVGTIYEEGSAPDPAVGWLGEEPTEEACPNCQDGWVRVSAGGEE